MRTIHNTPQLRQWLGRSSHTASHIGTEKFQFDDDIFAMTLAQVSHQHPAMNEASAEVRAAFLLLKEGATGKIEIPQHLDFRKIPIGWLIAILLAAILLAVVLVKADDEVGDWYYPNIVPRTQVLRAIRASNPLADPQTGGVIVELKNGSSVLAIRGGGLVIFQCDGSTVTCSFSGVTFTLSAAASGTGTLTASGLSLPVNQLILGNVYPDTKPLGSLGTTTTVLHGNAGGAPSFGAVVSADLNLTPSTCTNQVITVISLAAAGTCTTITSAYTSGTFPAAAHNLLSATHVDTVAASPVEGDMIIANSTPAWTKLALGSANRYPKSNGTDVVYSTLAASGTGSCTNQVVTAGNADAAPTCSSVSNAMLSNPATTPNGQTCTLGLTCNVNAGDTAHTVAINEGNGAQLAGAGPGSSGQCFISNGSSSDPTYQTCPSGSGFIGTSVSAVTVTSSTPAYLPFGGGGLSSTTEANVDQAAPDAATVSNLYVQTSLAAGAGNTFVITLRDGASSKAVTCTISGASATSCNDITHSFTPSAGDLIDWQLSATGTIIVTPNVLITAQWGGSITSGSVNNCGTSGSVAYYASTGTTVSCDAATAEANLVTAASGAGAANQYCASAGASRTCVYQDHPDVKIVPFANCVSGTAGGGVSYATSTWTAACRAGSNNLGGSLQAIPSTGAVLQFMIELPNDWDTSSQPYINVYWGNGAATSGTMIWTAASACSDVSTPGGTSDDPAFNAESAFTTRTAANANRMWYVGGQFTAITSGNGCKVLSPVIIKLTLSGTDGSNINAYQAVVTIPRRPVVQAN